MSARRNRAIAIAAAAAGCIAQIAGLLEIAGVGPLAAPGAEVNLFVGLVMFGVGTTVLAAVMERAAAASGRRRAWALAAFGGPFGAAAFALALSGKFGPVPSVKPDPEAGLSRDVPPGHYRPGEHPGQAVRTRLDRACGIGLTAAGAAFILWAAGQWLGLDAPPPEPDPSAIAGNERLALSRLRLIARAQEEYRRTDWDGDGEFTYAMFLVHLWRTVDGNSDPVDAGLVPKDLAFAMAASLAVDGYFYVILNARDGPPGSYDLYGVPFDATREWAVAAVPRKHGKTGLRTFLAHSSGKAHSRDQGGGAPTVYPRDDGLSERWREVTIAGF